MSIKMPPILVAPSILAADFGKLNEEIASVEEFSDRIHFDVMDGHFVPNISFGIPVLKSLKTKLPVDIHLMIEHPWEFYQEFVDSSPTAAAETTLIIHSEVCSDGGQAEARNQTHQRFPELPMRAALEKIIALGAKAGICIKPKTPVSEIKDVLDLVDQVLVMTVEPGFGGQKFMADMLPKVQELRALGFDRHIGIDGGVGIETAKPSIEAGGNIMAAGSSVFKAEDRREAVEKMRG